MGSLNHGHSSVKYNVVPAQQIYGKENSTSLEEAVCSKV